MRLANCLWHVTSDLSGVMKNIIAVMVMGMICSDEPDMYDMNRFMGSDLPGASAMSHAFLTLSTSCSCSDACLLTIFLPLLPNDGGVSGLAMLRVFLG